MTRRKREMVGLANEQDFPLLVELAVPPGGFGGAFLEFDAFHHQERRIPVRRGRNRHDSILLPRRRHCGRIPQSIRWRVLDLRTGEAQAADLGYVVGCPVVKLQPSQLRAAEALGGAIPQNVNFGITATTIIGFLQAHSIDYRIDTERTKFEPEQIAEEAKKFMW
jgi:hypothetical protein